MAGPPECQGSAPERGIAGTAKTVNLAVPRTSVPERNPMRLRSSLCSLLAATCFLGPPALTRAMSVMAPSFDQLVAAADLVVRGVVTDIHCITVDTAQGPAIKTLVTLQVERAFKGATGTDLTLWFLGGKLGRRTLTVVGMPTFRIGAREIVFVANNGRALCPLVAAGYGRYHIRHDPVANRDFVARDNDQPLESTDQVVHSLDEMPGHAAVPAAGMTPAAFEARIISAVAGASTPLQP